MAPRSPRPDNPARLRAGADLTAYLADGGMASLFVVTSEKIQQDQRRSKAPAPAADPWSLQAVVTELEEAALKGGERQMDHVRVDYIDGDAKGDGVNKLISDETRSMSFFGGMRVVTVVNAEQLAWAASGGKNKPGDPLETLISKLDRGAPPQFVLIFRAAQVDRRKKAWKQLLERAVEVVVPAMTPQRLEEYLMTAASPFGIHVDRGVAQLVWDRLGGADPARLRQMADQLLLDVGPGGHLRRAHVEAVVPIDRDAEIFKLSEHLRSGDVQAAFAVLQLLLSQGEQPLRVVGFLSNHYRKLMRVGDALSRGTPQPQIAKDLGMHPYPVKLAAQQLSRMRPGLVALALHNTFVASEKMKSSRFGAADGAQARWLEQLVMALAKNRLLGSRPSPRASQLR